MISAQNLTKVYGQITAADRVTFEIGAGELVGLLGPNGAGKSTTIRMITGASPPTRGRVSVAGFDTLEQSRQARRHVGYLPESSAIYTEAPVGAFLKYRAGLFGIAGKARKGAIDRVVGLCQLADVRSRTIGTLSKGYRQRVGLAAAMLHEPPALVLDEPTNGLDPGQVRAMREVIAGLAQDRTVLVSSHILAEVERTCTRVMVMARGRLIADAAPDELATRAGRGAEIRAEVKPADDAQGVLKAARGALGAGWDVRSEPIGDGWMRLSMASKEACKKGDDPRERVLSLLLAQGASVRELASVRPALEEAVMSLIERAETAEAVSA